MLRGMEERESSSCLWVVGSSCAPGRPPAEEEGVRALGGTGEACRGKKEVREEGREERWGGREEGGACLPVELEGAAAGRVKWTASWCSVFGVE